MEGETVNLTPAEWQVMEYLWESGEATGREATERLERENGWSRSTTLTLLRRLEAKGAVKSGLRDGRKTFLPVLRRDDAAQHETESLLQRVYSGSLSLMVSSFTKRQPISKSELDGLYALLRDLEEKQDDA